MVLEIVDPKHVRGGRDFRFPLRWRKLAGMQDFFIRGADRGKSASLVFEQIGLAT